MTPGLSRDYARRTADHQAAFILPRLQAGLHLLDVGCGPGSITLGLAEAVAPGQVVGVDHDQKHVEDARAAAAARGLSNTRFQQGDALALPFASGTFDVAFENDVFVHLADRARDAAVEMYRVLRPGGRIATRDTDAPAAVWGAQTERLRAFDELFFRWQASRGSDLTLGRRLPGLLRSAGFVDLVTSVSADTKSRPDEVSDHARTMALLLRGPVGSAALANGWADAGTLAAMEEEIHAWGTSPEAFFANVHVEVIGRRPA